MRNVRGRWGACGVVVALVSLVATLALAAHPAEFVHVQEGDLPIILSAPHGGSLAVPEVDVRTGRGIPKGPRGFVSGRDNGTEELAREVARMIEARFGKQPYCVFSRAHRKYLDPNRSAEIAYEDPDAKPVYDLYHGSLNRFSREVQKRFGRGLLLDIHGQSSARDTVFRGTQNGKTVTLLRERFGQSAQTGPESLFARFKSRGWTIHPDPLDGQERKGYLGGYIVQTYGSHQGYGIDAIQLEFGADFRSAAARSKTAAVLCESVVDYAASFLDIKLPPQPPPTPMPVADEDVLQVAVYQGPGTSKSRQTLVEVLSTAPQVQVRSVSPDDIRAGKLAGCDVLIQPGGSGSGQGKALGEEGRQKVREFVEGGGGYIGVCAGAYLATCDYSWSLGILDAKVVDREHWARGFGTVDISLTSFGRELLGAKENQIQIYYHQGPLLAPAGKPEVPDYDGLAKFESEIAKNGAPKGVMPGCTAIAAGVYEKGRVLCFSPHPERTEGQQQLLVRAVEWAAGRKAVEREPAAAGK